MFKKEDKALLVEEASKKLANKNKDNDEDGWVLTLKALRPEEIHTLLRAEGLEDEPVVLGWKWIREHDMLPL